MGRILAIFGAFIIFIILLVVLLTHGSKPSTPPVHVKTLPEYANSTAAVSMTTDGIVNGDELHRQIRITVAQDRRVVEVVQGYSGQVIDSHAFYNTEPAFDVFLRSINNAGFVVKSKKNKAPATELGQCALGLRYIFTLNDEGENVSRLWSSSCGASVGNWGGQLTTVQALFKLQIPNYNALTQNVNLEASQ
ncbi:MAG TPA: hypothetical protein VLF88_01040 [Candidatus Babeliales bacterium]|nr:hypothetical protein [Candidatus Babeliales bacterium]